MNAHVKRNFSNVFNRVAVLLAVFALAVAARAQAPRDLVEEALDQPMESLVIEDVPFRDALSRIEQTTGLRFSIEDPLLDLMPYGQRTRISVEIRDTSVRDGLSRVLDGLGLNMIVERGGVVLVPAAVLDRVGRRLTIAEVGVLSSLASSDWNTLRAAPDKPGFVYRFPPEEQADQRLESTLARTPGPNALRQLETACAILHWTWRVEDAAVVVESALADIERRIDLPIDLSCRQIALDELLTTLGSQIGVLMKFEPGALQKVAARERAVDLIQRGVSVRQILERVCGNTGLRYEVHADGVHVAAPVEDVSAPTLPTIYRWVRIEVEIKEGVVMDVFVRQDQLPAEFQDAARRKLAEILEIDPAE